MKLFSIIFIIIPFIISCATRKCCPDQFIWKKGKSIHSEYQGNLVLSDGNKIYMLTNADVDNFKSYDVQSKKWSLLPGIPVNVSYESGVVSNQVIYIMGGIDSSLNFSRYFQKFDILENKWTSLNQLQSARRNTSSVVYKDKIYLFGGLESSTGSEKDLHYSQLAQEYKLPEGSWSRKSDLPTARSNASAVVIKDKILVAGGNTENGETAIVEKYDPTGDEWSRVADLPFASGSLVLFVMDSSVYAIMPKPNEKETPMMKYDIDSDQWTQVDAFPGTGSYFQAIVIDDRVYLVSGEENPVIAWIGKKG